MAIIVGITDTISELSICKLALSKLGDEASITSVFPVDGSVQSSYCNTFYPVALRVLLDKHVWGFATKEAVLVEDTSNTSSAWKYAYHLPSDFMGIIDVRDSTFIDETNYPNNQEYSLQMGIVYTNIPGAIMLYSSNLATNILSFPPLFVEALTWLLASYLAGPIIKGDVGVSASQRLLQAFGAALKEAVESDSQYRKVRPLYVPASINARA